MISKFGKISYWDQLLQHAKTEDADGAKSVAVGDWHYAILKYNGIVSAQGSNFFGQCYVEEWTDIIKICADGAVAAGLKKDGTVVMAGHDYLGTHDAQNRSDIKDIALDYNIILGQRTDGSLIAAGDTGNINYLHTIHGAKNIGVEVHCVFWMYDNRIFYNGYDPLGFEAVFEWPNVKNYATDIKHLYAITEEGTLLYVGAPFEDPEGGLHGIKQNDA